MCSKPRVKTVLVHRPSCMLQFYIFAAKSNISLVRRPVRLISVALSKGNEYLNRSRDPMYNEVQFILVK